MPKEIFNRDYEFLDRKLLLSFEEIGRLVEVCAGLGVSKVRLTGGEPLLRKGIEGLVGSLARIDQVEDLTLTTNGSLLARKAERLAEAGLNRVTVSLDSLDDEVFQKMNDVGFSVEEVLAGVEVAATAGLTPVKVNVVVKRGVNENSVVPMAEHFRGTGHIVRFIEYMDVGVTNGWRLDDVVPAADVVAMIGANHELVPVAPDYPGEVATRWRYADGAGEFGVISSVSAPFCGSCSRLRLSAEGQIYTCLFATRGTDLRAPLRSGATDEELRNIISNVWAQRDDRYSEVRSAATIPFPKVEMSYIGG
jgi:cyclic pyranopterin phosphate synthase